MSPKDQLVIYNTLSRDKEPFVPIDPAHVRMYVCGPTVYDYVHIGNARPVVAFDVLYRLLKRRYPRVTYVRNITDIDDRIIARSADNKELRIYTTTIPTEHRLYTLTHDPQYRLSVAWQNIGYNQPTQPGFYLGDGMKAPPRPRISTTRK